MDQVERYVQALIAASTPEATAWNIEKLRAGKPCNWNYIDGCMLTALLALSEITGDGQYAAFAERVVDHFVQPDGDILTFDADKHTLDDINEGRVLFDLAEMTGKAKYKKAADRLHAALEAQPRTVEGSFWHKAIYPNQVWLDGIYMAQPFAALYALRQGNGDVSDVLRQVETVHLRMRDPVTGLYYHGYDASKTAFWCNPETGLSASFWLRAIGWFSVALADLMEILPPEGKKAIRPVFAGLMADVARFADAQTGLYAQVVDQPKREGNYLESSGSAMIAYAMLKGARLGELPAEYAALGQKTYQGLVDTCLKVTTEGLELDHICLVAGLGPENNRRRDGTFAYYISEPVVKNDAKGVAPFLLCYTEIRRLAKA